MKCRLLLIMLLCLVSIQSLTFAQYGSTEADRERTAGRGGGDVYGGRGGRNIATSDQSMESQLFALKHIQPDDMEDILSTVTDRARFAVVENSNSLLITAPAAELEKMSALIEELDVSKASTIHSLPIMCRVYMIEHLSRNQSWQSFSITLTVQDLISSSQIMTSLDPNRLHIKDFTQKNTFMGAKPVRRVNIRGQALSCQAVEQITQIIPNSRIDNLNWEDNSPPTPIAQVAPLPESLQSHIERFLGEDTKIAGYWFGNLSIPGEIRAPIEPWTLEFEMEPLGTDGLIGLSLSVEEVRGDEVWTIIRNNMQTKIGHPVIVGYTRDKDGSATTGALVVIPEPMPDLQ